VQTILARVPRALLLLLKTNDCLRAVDTQLGTPINSFIIMARFCTRAINEDRIKQSRGNLWTWLEAKLDIFAMDLRVALYAALLAIANALHELRYAIRPVHGPEQPKFRQRPLATTSAFSDIVVPSRAPAPASA
jgi:aarF domain-containing kinase